MEKLRATARANELLRLILENQQGLLDRTTISASGGSATGAFIASLRASLIEMYEADEES